MRYLHAPDVIMDFEIEMSDWGYVYDCCHNYSYVEILWCVLNLYHHDLDFAT